MKGVSVDALVEQPTQAGLERLRERLGLTIEVRTTAKKQEATKDLPYLRRFAIADYLPAIKPRHEAKDAKEIVIKPPVFKIDFEDQMGYDPKTRVMPAATIYPEARPGVHAAFVDYAILNNLPMGVFELVGDVGRFSLVRDNEFYLN